LNLVGGSIPDSQITVVRGGYYHTYLQAVIPPATVPLLNTKLPFSATYTKCSNGSLAGASVKSGNLLNYVTSIVCQSTSGTRTNTSVAVGTNTGTTTSWWCPGNMVVGGLYVRSGYLTDGAALHCRVNSILAGE